MRDYYEKVFRVNAVIFIILSAFICMAVELPINRMLKMMRLKPHLSK